MPIYKGNRKIGAIYKGSTKIGKVYKGSTLVYQSAKPYFITHSSYTNVLSYSYDGITWHQATLPLQGYCAGTAIGNGRAVITPYDSTSAQLDLIGFVTTNGSSWSQMSVPTRSISDECIFGKNMFLAFSKTVATSAYMTSIDGVNWTIRYLPSSGYFTFDYANGVYLALNRWQSNVAYTSSDGINWAQHNLPVSSSWYLMGTGDGSLNNTFYVVNSSQNVYKSTDGVNWTLAGTSNIGLSGSYSTAYADGRFVTALSNSNYTLITVYTSTNMCLWASTGLTISTSSSMEHANVAAIPGKFIITMSDGAGRAYYSTNGLNWNATTTPTTWNGYIAAGRL